MTTTEGDEVNNTKDAKVSGCGSCPFFSPGAGSSMGDPMCCDHPYWADKGAYAGCIIHRDVHNQIHLPEKCPLRAGPCHVSYTVELA